MNPVDEQRVSNCSKINRKFSIRKRFLRMRVLSHLGRKD